MIGAPHQCLLNCSSYTSPADPAAPNNPYADATVNSLAHELAEVVTDPFSPAAGGGTGGVAGRGWYDDATDDEIADKCVWQFPSDHLVLGDRRYRVQQLWAQPQPLSQPKMQSSMLRGTQDTAPFPSSRPTASPTAAAAVAAAAVAADGLPATATGACAMAPLD